MIPAQDAGPAPAQPHELALLEAYELLEAAQDRDVTERVARLDARARRESWGDVDVLLHFARSLSDREFARDDTEHVQAMVQAAHELGDPALLALALATTAMRAAGRRTALPAGLSGAEPLVRAVALLDDADSLVVHRVAARIEVAGAFHALGLWPLLHEQYALVEELFMARDDPFWGHVLRLQRRVVHINTMDMALDEACALAEVGDWEAAGHLAAERLPDVLPPLDPGWPSTWAAKLHAFADLFAALSGLPSPTDRDLVAEHARELENDPNLSMLSVADAIRARAAGDQARAAGLAEAGAGTIGLDVPVHVRLLALNLAAHQPLTPPAALIYAQELVSLRWNSRLSRISSMRAAIDAERRRVEHEFLRDQILVDDLTGLGNRRAYTAYLERVRRSVAGAKPRAPRPGRDRRRRLPRAPELVIMMIDVDHFKAVNDSFGHDAGDEVLRRIGSLLAAQVRSADLAARLGGDEFVVIMPQDSEGVGESRAEAIVRAVREHPWDEVAPGMAITISLGLYRGPASDLAHLPAEADRQLYVAKREGRGRVAQAVADKP